MKKLILILCIVGVLGCATTQAKPPDPNQPVTEEKTYNYTEDAVSILLDIGSTIGGWLIIH